MYISQNYHTIPSVEEAPEGASSTADEHSKFFAPIQHLGIRISGIVQGVGFRPFIYNLARLHGVHGSVRNDGQGVIIHAQGSEPLLQLFIKEIHELAPPAARIETLDATVLPLDAYDDFLILQSESQENPFTQISPDLALCEDCRRELVSTSDRRHGFAFINCTNCGPRFTIIRDVPYDRPSTTMSGFEMCPACKTEYENPADRRFHAQPIACDRCGPSLTYCIKTKDGWERTASGNLLELIEADLRAGKILLIQGIGGFHLACDARNESAVCELRLRKHREEKPLAVMFPNESALREWCNVSDLELAWLKSARAPIVLIRKKRDTAVAASVAPGNPSLGCLLPYSPLHELLLGRLGFPLVMTSANRSEEPITYKVDDALNTLGDVADCALIHNREIHMFADDSVTRVVNGSPRVWRRSRGYVPESVRVPERFKVSTLGFGPQLKNTFCLGKEHSALLSQHLGDMENEISIAAEERALDHFLNVFHADVALGVCDLHPDYTTTRLAEVWCNRQSVSLVRVQHHHAHLVSCLAENNETKPAIGLCLDGTGYGTDGTIWGGEILVGNASSFQRVGHLETVQMPGGDRAARDPWRMALAWLDKTYGEQLPQVKLELLTDLAKRFDEQRLQLLLRSNANPLTSSLGRLFDAVAAIVCFGMRSQFEGQAAMQLEWGMSTSETGEYSTELHTESGELILAFTPTVREIVADVQSDTSPEVISRRFHNTVVSAFVEAALKVREIHALDTVALSGGCFQNAFLLTEMENRLSAKGFRVLSHRQIPTNDGGVALGQVCVANAINRG